MILELCRSGQGNKPDLPDARKSHHRSESKLNRWIVRVEAKAKRLEELSTRMPTATMSMMKYMADPQVQAAMQRMTQVMQTMGD